VNHRKAIAFLAGVAIVAVACGGSSSSSPDGADGGDGSQNDGGSSGTVGGSASNYCDATLGAFVQYLGKCCTNDDKANAGYALLAGLLSAAQASCSKTLDAGVSKGRLSEDDGQLASCNSAISQVLPSLCGGPPVNTSTIDVNACKNVYKGTVAAGGACAGDQECQDGLTCVGWTSSSDGACKTPPAIGEPCGEGPAEAGTLQLTTNFNFGTHPACAPGAYCSISKCVAQVADGQSCLADTKNQCASGHCFEGKCGSTMPSAQGGPCTSKTDCNSGLYCDKPSATAAGTCQAQKTAGATCTNQQNECKGNCTAGKCVTFCGSG
jgi:hypothetical protein